MRNIILIITVLFAFNANAVEPDSINFGSFGNVYIYNTNATPENVILFLSGDGGWDKISIDIVSNFTNKGSLVVGINYKSYLKNLKKVKSMCFYPAGDLEEISIMIQKRLKYTHYFKPILVGYSSGATLAYGALAQAPANTFKGVIALGFCPDIEIDRPLCNGTSLHSHILKDSISYYLEPCKNLTAPFIVLQGMIDQACSFSNTEKFMASIPLGQLVALPKVGHGFIVAHSWLPQFWEAYHTINDRSTYSDSMFKNLQLAQSSIVPDHYIENLPITITRSTVEKNLPTVFFISGDGGWTSFDQELCSKMNEFGFSTIGLDAQKYFWNERQPHETSIDFENSIQHYLKLWDCNSFVVIGYSFGACVAPFIVDNFSDSLKHILKQVYCFSPDMTGDFEIHVADMLQLKTNGKYNVLNQLIKIRQLNPVCVFGKEENSEIIKQLVNTNIKTEFLQGNHHYNNDFKAISDIVQKYSQKQ